MKRISILLIILFSVNFTKAQWLPTNGPYLSSKHIGMEVDKFAFSGNTICAIINNMVYLSEDNGVSWIFASKGLNYVRNVALSDSVTYAGTSGQGMYLSTNYGSTYHPVNANLPAYGVINAILLSKNAVLIAVSTYETPYLNNVYHSTNQGTTWEMTSGLDNKNVKCIVSNGENLYAGTTHGAFMSIDNGLNWTNIGLTNHTIDAMAVNGNRLFAVENISSGGVYFSSDNGANWTPVYSGLASNDISSIAIDNEYVYAGGYWTGVYRSNDNGANWSLMNNGYCFDNVKTLGVNANQLNVGSIRGFTSSINQGSSWKCDLINFDLYITSVVNCGTNIIAAGTDGRYTSQDNGINWERFLLYSNVLTSTDSVVFSGSKNKVSISTDCGSSWLYPANRGIADDANISSMVSEKDKIFLGTNAYGVYFSGNAGENWERKVQGLTDLNVNALTLNDSVLVAGTNNSGVFVSTDNGFNWKAASNGISDTCIQTLARYKNSEYAGTKTHGVFKSSDFGVHWRQTNKGLLDTNITTLYTCGENVFAAVSGGGFYMSPDNGLNWSAYNSGLMNYNINAISENGTDIYVGTDGGGIWQRPLSQLPLTFSVKKIMVSDQKICTGNSASIKVSLIGGTPPYTYLWSDGSHTSSITVTPSETTTYILTAIDNNSAITTAEATVIVKPKPETPVLSWSGNTLISSATSGNVWMIDRNVIYGVDSNKFVATVKGKYSLVVVKDGCVSDTSNLVSLGIGGFLPDEMTKIYPNPANDQITIETFYKGKNVIMSFCDINGREMIKQHLISNKSFVDVSSFPKGIYLIKLVGENTTEVRKIILK